VPVTSGWRSSAKRRSQTTNPHSVPLEFPFMTIFRMAHTVYTSVYKSVMPCTLLRSRHFRTGGIPTVKVMPSASADRIRSPRGPALADDRGR
jgi:hypothetical protein